MGKKAVFFDIDGTLYDLSIGVPLSAVQAIRGLRDNGHLAFLCTGRPSVIIPAEISDIGFDGIISGCGTYIEYQGQVLEDYYGESSKMYDAVKYLSERGYMVLGESAHSIYYADRDCSEKGKEMFRTLSENLGSKFLTIETPDIRISKIYVNFEGKVFDEEEAAILNRDFDVVVHGESIAEILPKEYNKALGIERLIKHIGIDRENTYAFGDSMNDKQMLSYVKYGIAMGNSVPSILKQAEYVTERLENDGIFKGLKQFGLI
jgi:Cof subfamily protein (haloacid dehalogenase superfamily)